MTAHFKIKTALTIALLLGITTMSFAQFSGGGVLGVNFSNLRGSSTSGNSMLIGYKVGGFANYSMVNVISGKMGDILSIQGELTFEQKGATAKYSGLTSSGEEKTYSAEQVFTYIVTPLIAKFTFTPGKKFSYYGEGGIFVGSLIGLTVNGKKSWNEDLDSSTDPRKYRQEYSGFDFGVLIGGGASMPFGGRRSPWAVFANIRGSIGLMNIGEEKENTPDVLKPYLEDVKTGAVSFVVGVSYKF